MKGFTLFFAMLVGSLALAVGLAIYDLTVRELNLSAIVKQSQYAIYAADTGAECALYWDSKYTAGGYVNESIFATSTASINYGNSHMPTVNANITCNTQDITAPNSYVSNTFTNSNAGWSVTAPDATHATTVFVISLGTSNASPCAVVTVSKSGAPSQTTIVSQGFNTCVVGPLQLQRSLQVSY